MNIPIEEMLQIIGELTVKVRLFEQENAALKAELEALRAEQPEAEPDGGGDSRPS